ncbi:hypothetical protein G3142_005483 [Salmonella enterica subsp. enterica serovar Montevideo]|nr:hypothetical protein [Salmonella enterica subsp. enterica serovar Montevideo]EEK7814370.1 hypothetical protein [Salmonella enterica subsp. enterica serovar Montevideo]
MFSILCMCKAVSIRKNILITSYRCWLIMPRRVSTDKGLASLPRWAIT